MLHHEVLIIGGGLAGLMAALAASERADVAVLSKLYPTRSHSGAAQGGFNSALGEDDSIEAHIFDTVQGGDYLGDQEAIEVLCSDGPEVILELERLGVPWTRREDGRLAQRSLGGAGFPRACFAADFSGHVVLHTLYEQILRRGVKIYPEWYLLKLLVEDGRVAGVLAYDLARASFEVVRSKAVILATGGCGRVFSKTTNAHASTGDGMALAYRAGAVLSDLEFVQFHPTVLYVAGAARSLITEAVRGEGAYLRDKNGYRFMLDEDPRAERATRDVVSQAIFRCMERTQHPNVYLDMTHLDPQVARRRFPGIDRVCRSFGLDLTRDLIPVRPGAHYCIGGVTVDLEGRTTVPGLWAAGEVTCSGLHGANRLASNSLLEGLVFGTSCARGAVREIRQMPDRWQAGPNRYIIPNSDPDLLDVADITNSLRALMVRNMGIVRDRRRLLDAQRDVAFWCRYVLSREFTDRRGWELQNMLTISRLMIGSALAREESRGCHFRSDFPNRDDRNWQRHLVCPRFPVD
ncbi:MAG: L-aspartate oxidase, partial [Firmicutes bacterium]|nr:L-aspartate oxidase [Bacillota bacterium]